MKIAITGTHGTGKTTLSYALAAHYKQQGHNVKVIQEVARTCPFPINEGMTIDAAKWIYLEHSRKELEAGAKHDFVIGDRSVYDSFAYARYFKLSTISLYGMEYSAFSQMRNYDQIIFVRPDLPLQTDGTRSANQEFQKGIDEILFEMIQYFNIIEITSSQIFDTEQSWKQFCL